eukprot:9608704-Lingulodinium_polyedra.AAC.1
MWKLLFVVDVLLFAESSASVEGSRRQAFSERIAWIDEGQWGSLLSTADAHGARQRDTSDKNVAVATRVEELIKAGELSRAAAA